MDGVGLLLEFVLDVNVVDAILAILVAEVTAANASDAIPAGLGTGPIAIGEDARDAVIALPASTIAPANCIDLLSWNCFLKSASSSLLPFLTFFSLFSIARLLIPSIAEID